MSLVAKLIDSLAASIAESIGGQACTAGCNPKATIESKRTFTSTRFVEQEETAEEVVVRPDDTNKEIVAVHDNNDSPVACSLTGPLASMAQSRTQPRSFLAPVAPPQDLHFLVPEVLLQRSVCVSGPHGPIMVELPEDALPGEQRTWRLGPDGQQVLIPDGMTEGMTIECELEGRIVQAVVPAGKVPGDSFEVVPPALVVMIPQGACPGDTLEFPGLDGEPLKVPAPEGLLPGQYFSLLL